MFIKDHIEFVGDDGKVWQILFDYLKDRNRFLSLHAPHQYQRRNIIFKKLSVDDGQDAKIARLEKEVDKLTDRISQLEAALKEKSNETGATITMHFHIHLSLSITLSDAIRIAFLRNLFNNITCQNVKELNEV